VRNDVYCSVPELSIQISLSISSLVHRRLPLVDLTLLVLLHFTSLVANCLSLVHGLHRASGVVPLDLKVAPDFMLQLICGGFLTCVSGGLVVGHQVFVIGQLDLVLVRILNDLFEDGSHWFVLLRVTAVVLDLDCLSLGMSSLLNPVLQVL